MNATAKELAKMAKKKGICDEWYKELKRLNNKPAMVDMYLRGIDFCLANDYPDNDYIRANFKGVMEDQGVFLDDKISLTNYRKCVALGNTHGEVRVSQYKVCEVFVKHNANLTVTAEDNAFVEIDMFDDSNLSVIATGNAKIHINRYGGALTVKEEDSGTVKVVEKDSKTY